MGAPQSNVVTTGQGVESHSNIYSSDMVTTGPQDEATRNASTSD